MAENLSNQRKEELILKYHQDSDYTIKEAKEILKDEHNITSGEYQYYAYDKPRRQENPEEYRKKQNEYRRKRYEEDEEFRNKQKKKSREVQQSGD